MVSYAVKAQACAWANALQTGVNPSISDLARLVFYLSPDRDRLDKLGDGQDG